MGGYVSPGATVSANPSGIYGLLDEFQAYYYGLKAAYDCYPYLKEYGAYEDTAIVHEYITFLYGSISGSYYEFKWFILLYMDYVKINFPHLYKQFIESREFLTAFLYFNEHFENLVEVLIPERVRMLITELNGLGKEAYSINEINERRVSYTETTNRSIHSRSAGRSTEIKDELKNEKYTNMVLEFRNALDTFSNG
jgi:hypothetical protein